MLWPKKKKTMQQRACWGWSIDEQVEEEETAQGYIDALKMIKDNGFGIYTLDKELGARTYTQAAPLAAEVSAGFYLSKAKIPYRLSMGYLFVTEKPIKMSEDKKR